jgi:hypothetical protein
VFDGDVLKGSSTWIVVGDTIGAQSRQAVAGAVPSDLDVITVADSDLEQLPIVDGSREPEPLSLAKAIAQVRGITGHDWPSSALCADPRLEAEVSKIGELRDSLAAKTSESVKTLALQDPGNQASLMKRWLEQKSAKDKEVVTALSAASIAANAIPMVGPVLSALLSIVSAVGGQAAVGPAPSSTPIREQFDRESYRGFSALYFVAERPITGDTWEEVDRAKALRTTAFTDMVDRTLDVLSKALNLPLRCIFPAWWEPGSPKPSGQRLREFRNRALHFASDWEEFRGGASLDFGKPRFLIEYLPDPDSEGIKALLSRDAKNLPTGAFFSQFSKSTT